MVWKRYRKPVELICSIDGEGRLYFYEEVRRKIKGLSWITFFYNGESKQLSLKLSGRESRDSYHFDADGNTRLTVPAGAYRALGLHPRKTVPKRKFKVIYDKDKYRLIIDLEQPL
jgi:hypothetical protein